MDYVYHYAVQLQQYGYEVFVDIEGFKSPSKIFCRFVPDMVLKIGDKITIIELTCCFEYNFSKSRKYKKKWTRIR